MNSSPSVRFPVLKPSLRVLLMLACLPLLPAMAARAQEDPAEKEEIKERSGENFIRVRVDRDDEPVAMETSVTRYIGVNKHGQRVTVDLIGVVHIGEQEYYESLNELFDGYDSVLYELVAPEGTVIPEGGRGEDSGLNPVAALQLGMKSALGLEFQLNHINYTASNFVHADMSPDEFLESMKKNDESFFKMAMKMVGQGIARQHSPAKSGQMTEASLMMAMLSGNRQQSMRRLMASEMQKMESGMLIFNGKDGSTIIHHRNRKALSVMQEQIDAGKQQLGVFYGAGHLPHMEKLLIEEYKMQRAGQFWLEAWDLR